VFVLQPRANQYTIGHEFIHTTPFAWTVNQMLGECGLNYHNNADANYGNGVYVGSYQHTRLDRVRAVMGPALGSDTWITQCSYWHLLKYLTGTPDPDLLLVRGYLAKRGASVAGSFDKFYELRGESELQPGQRTADGYSIVLRDRSNRVLAEYPFQAVWQIPDLARAQDHSLHLSSGEISQVASRRFGWTRGCSRQQDTQCECTWRKDPVTSFK
jgi:hypothetical protein